MSTINSGSLNLSSIKRSRLKTTSLMVTLLLLSEVVSGCATTGRKRVAIGAGSGAAAGALGGALFTPNKESAGVNALVFGLIGTLIGAGWAYLTDTAPPSADDRPSLKDKEQGTDEDTDLYVVKPESNLPEFVKERLSPLMVESFVERDKISEEGTLHEPHRAYRIKRPAEFLNRPKKKAAK